MHLETPPPPPSRLALVSPAIDAVVLRCLEKEPEARFPSVAAFMDAFKAAVFGGEVPVRPRTGIGVLVSAVADGAVDEDTVADGVVALEEGETRLRAAGYQIAFQTSREALGVIVAPARRSRGADGAPGGRSSSASGCTAMLRGASSPRGCGWRSPSTAPTCSARGVERDRRRQAAAGPRLELGARQRGGQARAAGRRSETASVARGCRRALAAQGGEDALVHGCGPRSRRNGRAGGRRNSTLVAPATIEVVYGHRLLVTGRCRSRSRWRSGRQRGGREGGRGKALSGWRSFSACQPVNQEARRRRP
jgi:hypothetical protein